MHFEMLDVTVRDYIKELQASHEKRIKELENNFETKITELKNDYAVLKEKYDLVIYQKFVRSAERLRTDKNQPLLFSLEEVKADVKQKQQELQEVKSHMRKKKGRKAIDPKIPRVEKIIDIPEDEKTCACGTTLTKIGEESNEKLHIIPPRIYVEKTIRPKYACRHCEGTTDEDKPAIMIAPVEPSIIPKSIVSASLLSTIIIQKYEDHLPYYRQEKQFERIMVRISRQDMSNWQQQAYNKLKPLFILLKEMLKSGPVIQMDETTVQVMGEEGRSDTDKSYMWLARGGPPEKPVVLYEYRQSRGGKHAKEILEGYSGYLQTDGYTGYDTAIEGNNSIIHVGCFAHARRHFFEAAQVTSQSSKAEEGIQYIKTLYIIESKLRKRYEQDKDLKKFLRVRQMCAWRPAKDFKQWLIKLKVEVPESVLLGKAISYTLTQWDKLIKYLESPYLTPDNNACENAIRPFVLGRKNWLFNKSPDGAESSCGMYSLIQTAKQNGVNPAQYLTALFEKVPLAVSQEDWQKLLPWNVFTP